MAESRDKILEEARALFLAEGVDGVSMRKVAARVGVSATALYRHFQNKDELLNQIMLGGVAAFTEYMAPALAAGSTEERVRLGALAFLRFGLEQPSQYQVFFLRREYSELQRVSREIGKHTRAAFRVLVERVREGMDEGYFAPGDPAEMALTIVAHCHGLMSIYLLGKVRMGRRAFSALFLNSLGHLIRGLRAASAAA